MALLNFTCEPGQLTVLGAVGPGDGSGEVATSERTEQERAKLVWAPEGAFTSSSNLTQYILLQRMGDMDGQCNTWWCILIVVAAFVLGVVAACFVCWACSAFYGPQKTVEVVTVEANEIGDGSRGGARDEEMPMRSLGPGRGLEEASPGAEEETPHWPSNED